MCLPRLSDRVQRSARKPSNGEGGGISDAIMGKALPLLALVFIVFLLALLSLAQPAYLSFRQTLCKIFQPFLLVRPFRVSITYLQLHLFQCAGSDFYEQTKIAHMNVLHMTSFRLILSLGVLLCLVGSWHLFTDKSEYLFTSCGLSKSSDSRFSRSFSSGTSKKTESVYWF